MSLLAEARDAGVEFDEVVQLVVYQGLCEAWSSRAARAVGAAGWLSVVCGSWSDDGDDGDGDGDDDGDVEAVKAGEVSGEDCDAGICSVT